MGKPTLIITDPREVTRRCLSQRPVSREHAIRSILVQNGKPAPKK